MEEILEIVNDIENWYCRMNQTEYICQRGQNIIEQAEIERMVNLLCEKCKEKLKNLT